MTPVFQKPIPPDAFLCNHNPPPTHPPTHITPLFHLFFSSLPPEWLPSALPGAVPPVAARVWCIPVYWYLGEVINEMSSMREGGLVCLSVCACGADGCPCSVSEYPKLDMAHQGSPPAPQICRRRSMFILYFLHFSLFVTVFTVLFLFFCAFFFRCTLFYMFFFFCHCFI